MTKNTNGPPIILPVLLAVVGIGALATAIVLVPAMVQRFAEAKAPRVIEGPAVSEEAREPAEEAREPAEEAREPAEEARSDQREWRIEIDPDSYEIGPQGDAAIDAMIAMLAANESTRLVLTGINHPSRSSKRAVKAAKVVKERVVADVGVTRTRVSTRGEQDPLLEGVIVKALITGGDR